MKKISIMVVSIVLLGSMAFAWGKDRPGDGFGGRSGHGGGDIYRMCDVLDLTERQEDSVFDIKKSYRRKTKPLAKDLKEYRKELGEVLSSERPDKEAARKIVRNMGKISTRLHVLKIEELFEISDVLSPRQKEKLRDLKMRHKDRRSDRRSDEVPVRRDIK